MRAFYRLLLALLLALALCAGALAEPAADAVQSDAAARAASFREVVLLIPNEKPNKVLTEANRPGLTLSVALIANALADTDVKLSFVGTVPQEPDVPATADPAAADGLAQAVTAMEGMPVGTGNRETTYLRQRVDQIAGQAGASRLVVVLLDGVCGDKDSAFDSMENRDKTRSESLEMLFIGLDDSENAVKKDPKIIGQLTNDLYTDDDYHLLAGDTPTAKAMDLVNLVLEKLGEAPYASRRLTRRDDMLDAAALLERPLFLYADPEALTRAAEDVERSAVDGEMPAEPALRPDDGRTEEDGDAAAEASGEEESAESAGEPFRAAFGGYLLSSAVPETADSVEALSNGMLEVRLELDPIEDVVAGAGEDIPLTARVLAGEAETDRVPVAFELNGEALEDGVIPGAALTEAAKCTVTATATKSDYNIDLTESQSFRVLGAPEFTAEQTEYAAKDTVDGPRTYAVLEDRFALFEDPNRDGIEKVEVALSDDGLANTSEKGLTLEGSFEGVEHAVEVKLTATNKAGLTAEGTLKVTLTSVPAIIAGAKLEVSGAQEQYTEGDSVDVEFSLSNTTVRELTTAGMDDSWLDHIAVYVSENDAEPVAAEGNIDGWRYSAQPGVGSYTLNAWVIADTEEPDPQAEPSATVTFEVVELVTPSPEPTDTPTPPPTPTPEPTVMEQLTDKLGIGGLAGIGAGIVALILALVLLIRKSAAPRFSGMLRVNVTTKDGTYNSKPIDLTEWGKKAVAFGTLIGQSGLPPMSLLTSGELAEKLVFKPAKDGVLVVNKAHALRGPEKQIVEEGSPAVYTIKETGIELVYKR